MKKFLFASILLVVLGAGCVLPGTKQTPEKVHYHAGFQIYVDDTLQDFSAMEYMELKPCTPDDVDEDETVHLHNGVGDVIHVHHANMTWQNVLDYIAQRQPIVFGDLKEKGIRGYVNGLPVDDIAATPIESYDSVVIIIGHDAGDIDEKLHHAVTVDRIKHVEADKENCGS